MCAAGDDCDRVDGPVRQDAQIGVKPLEGGHDFLDRHHHALRGEGGFLLHADNAFDQDVAGRARLLRVDEGDVGAVRGDGGELFAGEGISDRLDVRVDPRQLGALVTTEHGHGQTGGAGLVGLGHRRVRVLDGLNGARVAVFDGVAHAAEQADAGIAGIGEDHLLREAHADHLVVDDVGRHAQQSEVADALADGFVRGSVGDQVGEAFERDDVAGFEVTRDRVAEGQEFSHSIGLR